MPVRTAQVFFEPEATAGTAETTPDATDVLTCREATWEIQGAPTQRDAMLAELDTLPPVAPHALHASGVLQLEESEASAIDTAPELSEVYEAGGYTETVNGSTSTVYALTAAPNLVSAISSGTVTLQEAPAGDGHEYRAAGCMFGLEWSWSDSAPLRVAASYVGSYIRPADDAALDAATYYGGLPYSKLTTFTLASYSPVVQSLTINSGLEPTVRPSGGGATNNAFGYRWPCYLNRSGPVTCDIVIELEDQAIYPLYAALEGTAVGTVTAAFAGAARTTTHVLNSCYCVGVSQAQDRPKRVTVNLTAHATAGTTEAHVVTNT